MLAYGAQNLGVVIPRGKRSYAPLEQGKRRVGNKQAWVDLFTTAETRAIGAGSVGRIEAEVARLELVHRMAMLGACESQRIEMVARKNVRKTWSRLLGIGFDAFLIDDMAYHAPIGELRRRLHRFGDAA